MKVLHILRRNAFIKDKLLCPNNSKHFYYMEKSTKGDSSSSSSSGSDSDGDDLKKKRSKSNLKSDNTLNKLNSLLKQLVEQDIVAKSSKLELAKPTNKRLNDNKKDDSEITENSEKKMVEAVKNVADVLGGDVKQTESELLSKLLSPLSTSQPTAKSLNDIVKGMKIDREPKSKEQSRADQVRGILQQLHNKHGAESSKAERRTRKMPQKNQKHEIVIRKIDLFGSEPLGIFTNKDTLKDVPGNKTWEALHERDLKLAVTHPPANYFQQMILWTEQGKLWKFPIDNEQGLDEEKKVYFAKHVFLEKHLEPWCPPRGPIRHFMELVCVGLSKNPYLTVEAKKEHIEWYRQYFEDKKKLLQEVGAFPLDSKMPQKAIE